MRQWHQGKEGFMKVTRIRMSIGYTVGGTVRQGIILYEAAPKVIETLIEKGYTCNLNGCGMRVYKL